MLNLFLQTYLQFLKKSKPGRLVIVTDPPFGGRCELVANTYKTIMKDFAEAHEKVEAEKWTIFVHYLNDDLNKGEIQVPSPIITTKGTGHLNSR